MTLMIMKYLYISTLVGIYCMIRNRDFAELPENEDWSVAKRLAFCTVVFIVVVILAVPTQIYNLIKES